MATTARSTALTDGVVRVPATRSRVREGHGWHPLGPMNLNHLNLRVRDADACRDFYERHFGFRLAFEADDGYFVQNEDGFLLALVPADDHQPLPPGFHIGFGLDDPAEVGDLHERLSSLGVQTTEVEDFRPDEAYVTFRCWDPDGTEVEIFWEQP